MQIYADSACQALAHMPQWNGQSCCRECLREVLITTQCLLFWLFCVLKQRIYVKHQGYSKWSNIYVLSFLLFFFLLLLTETYYNLSSDYSTLVEHSTLRKLWDTSTLSQYICWTNLGRRIYLYFLTLGTLAFPQALEITAWYLRFKEVRGNAVLK